MKTKKFLFYNLVFAIFVLCLVACNGKPSPDTDVVTTPRGEPILSVDTLIYETDTESFTLVMKADSTADAKLTYQLLMDGDNELQKNETGEFHNVEPFENGYDVKLTVEWSDTTIYRQMHVVGFVAPAKPVEKLTSEELQQLILSKESSLTRGTNEHISQSFTLKVIDSQDPPTMMRDVIHRLENGEWKSIQVVNVEYDDNNLVTAITLKPVGEQVVVIEEDDYDYQDFDF